MRIYPIPLIAAWLLSCFTASAQDDPRYTLLLKSGNIIPVKNINSTSITSFNSRASRSAGKTFAILQFEHIPTVSERQQLFQEGIELLDYIPNNAYTVTITGPLNEITLQRMQARAIIEPTAQQKMQPELAIGAFPAHAVKTPGTLDVWISFPKSFLVDQVKQELTRNNFDLINTDYQRYRILSLHIAASRLEELASAPWVEYVQAIPRPDQPLNTNGRAASRGNVLKAPLSAGGKNLD